MALKLAWHPVRRLSTREIVCRKQEGGAVDIQSFCLALKGKISPRNSSRCNHSFLYFPLCHLFFCFATKSITVFIKK
jgi:hypothetical protein